MRAPGSRRASEERVGSLWKGGARPVPPCLREGPERGVQDDAPYPLREARGVLGGDAGAPGRSEQVDAREPQPLPDLLELVDGRAHSGGCPQLQAFAGHRLRHPDQGRAGRRSVPQEGSGHGTAGPRSLGRGDAIPGDDGEALDRHRRRTLEEERYDRDPGASRVVGDDGSRRERSAERGSPGDDEVLDHDLPVRGTLADDLAAPTVDRGALGSWFTRAARGREGCWRPAGARGEQGERREAPNEPPRVP